MCYSAQVQADYKKYVVMFGATMSIRDVYEIFYRRGLDPRIKIPKAVEASFRDPQSDDERAIAPVSWGRASFFNCSMIGRPCSNSPNEATCIQITLSAGF